MPRKPRLKPDTFVPSADLHALAREHFDASGKTQTELAAEMGLSAPTVSLALTPKRAGSNRYDGTRADIIRHLTGLSPVPGFRFEKPEDGASD